MAAALVSAALRASRILAAGAKSGQADFYITSTDAADQYSAQLMDLRPEFFGVRGRADSFVGACAERSC